MRFSRPAACRTPREYGRTARRAISFAKKKRRKPTALPNSPTVAGSAVANPPRSCAIYVYARARARERGANRGKKVVMTGSVVYG